MKRLLWVLPAVLLLAACAAQSAPSSSSAGPAFGGAATDGAVGIAKSGVAVGAPPQTSETGSNGVPVPQAFDPTRSIILTANIAMKATDPWATAEKALASALESLGQEFRLGPGEAAFYGPKIDFQVRDALRREFTNSTVQVDFQLPQKFDLEYVAEDGSRKRPVMVHRGAAGSMERLFAYLIERWAGAFPTWMAPVQVVVIPITDEQNAYAAKVAERLRRANVRVEVNDQSERMQKKIREAQRMKVPYMAIVGAREVESDQVNVRNRAGEETPEALEDFAARLVAEIAEKRRPDR